jgi:hypothetical protein
MSAHKKRCPQEVTAIRSGQTATRCAALYELAAPRAGFIEFVLVAIASRIATSARILRLWRETGRA